MTYDLQCHHGLSDMEAACADGACPLCLAIKINRLEEGTERFWKAQWQEASTRAERLAAENDALKAADRDHAAVARVRDQRLSDALAELAEIRSGKV